MGNVKPHIKKAALYAGVYTGIVAVGFIDYISGAEVRVPSFYLIPLAVAGWKLKRTGAVLAALLAASVWPFAQYASGIHSWSPAIWGFNIVMQGLVFCTVALLVAELAHRLRAEESMSRTDALTGLRNRRAIIEQAALALRLCKRQGCSVSMAYIDLDNFKQVNDTYGHERGDQVLKQCASIINASLRATDLAARLGGDEFVLILPTTSPQNAKELMGRLQRQLHEDAVLQAVGVTATIGVYGEDVSTMDIEDLMKRADARMYEGKSAGKNRVHG